MQKSFIAAAAQPLILSVLAKEASYGYKIVKNLNALLSGEMEWPEATLYPILKRMEKVGLIQSQWAMSENGRPRKYYHITEQGLKSLQKETRNWKNVSSILNRMYNDTLSDEGSFASEEN